MHLNAKCLIGMYTQDSNNRMIFNDLNIKVHILLHTLFGMSALEKYKTNKQKLNLTYFSNKKTYLTPLRRFIYAIIYSHNKT